MVTARVGKNVIVIKGVQRESISYLPETPEEAVSIKAATSELSSTQKGNLRNRLSLSVPYGYHEQVKKIALMNRMDSLFHRLVERLIEFACVGGEWELKVPREAGEAQIKKIEKQKQFWDHFSSRINFGVPNVIPGKDEVDEWVIRNILFNGMAIVDWRNGNLKFEGNDYRVPVHMVTQNPQNIVITRKEGRFDREEMWYYVGDRGEKILENQGDKVVSTDYPEGVRGWKKLDPLGRGVDGKLTNEQSFAIKYQWTPADNTAAIRSNSTIIGQGLYPTPPFIGLLSTTMQRQALSAADVAILDSIIDSILIWSIGDDTILKTRGGNEEYLPHEPEPEKLDESGKVLEKSTMEKIEDMIQVDELSQQGGMLNLFVPHWIKPEYLAPDTASLLDSEKYKIPFIELLNAFGILAMPYNDSSNKMENANRQNLEQMIFLVRRKVKRFWEALASVIVENNEGLTIEPNWKWNPINTITDKYRAQITEAAKMGRVSPQSHQLILDIDPDVENQRMKQNLSDGTKKVLDDSVPVTFVQESTTDGGSTKRTTSTTSPKEGQGRPKGK